MYIGTDKLLPMSRFTAEGASARGGGRRGRGGGGRGGRGGGGFRGRGNE